jgi:aminoglycoside 6-adenylyltransferase
MDRFKELKERLCSLAESDAKIKALVVIGSSARTYSKADEYSDLDVIVATEEPEAWLYGEYPARLGKMKMSFVEPAIGGVKERRVLYEGSYDVDLIALTPDQFRDAVVSGLCNEVMNRGYVVIYDTMGIASVLKEYVRIGVKHDLLSQEDFNNMVNDFFFHTVWTSKKIQRGELWTAKMCLDSYMKNHLLRIIEMYTISVNKADVWHSGRFLEKWADKEIIDRLRSCFAHYDRDDIISALISNYELFSNLAKCVASYCSYSYPDEADIYAGELLRQSILQH